MKTHKPQRNWMRAKRMWIVGTCSFALGIVIVALTALADAPQPVLSITSLGSNQFSVRVTNGVSGTNYTLFWTPVLADENWPWQVLGVGDTNFTVDGGDWPLSFFRVLLGSDQDGDGVTEQYDANSNDPAIGILSVTIKSPTNGAVLQ